MLAVIVLYTLPFCLVVYLYNVYKRLAYIPGPPFHKFTNLPRLSSVYRRKAHDEQVALHKRYGDLVRLGPDMISVSGPDFVSQIYGIGKGMVKSDFYAVFQNIVNGRRAASLVAMTDESEHARTKRSIAHAYSLSTLVEFEPLVDSTTEVFLDHLERKFAETGDVCDLGRWLQYYAFDVIGELTFSKRLGFIETGDDVEDIISSIGRNFDYFSVVGQMPWLDDTFLGKNPLYIKYMAKPVASPILRFAQRLLQERLLEVEQRSEKDGSSPSENSSSGKSKTSSHTKPDFLTRFLQIRQSLSSSTPASKDTTTDKDDQKDSPTDDTTMSDRQLLSYLFMNINAGSDTIASTLRAIFYHLLKNPASLTKLTSELKQAHQSGHLTLPCPTWHETQSPSHLSYLRAVIREGLRLNPALSLPLERVVPPQGMTLSLPSPSSPPVSIPGGTIIGINPYVLHRDTRIFGPDAPIWNPDRWLACSSDHLKQMDQSILSFGAGKRSCMGKNIALLELHKIVPALIMRFEIGLISPETKWMVRNSWVLNHEGILVRLVGRRGN